MAEVEDLELRQLRDAEQDQLADEGIACKFQLEEVWAAFDEGFHAALDWAIGQVEHLQPQQVSVAEIAADPLIKLP